MKTTCWSLLWLTLKKHWPEVLGLAVLASLPSELLSEAKGWGAMDLQGYLADLAWFPVNLLCQLALLRRMGGLLHSEASRPALLGDTLASTLGANFLFSLRFCVVVLLSALPALVFLSIFGVEARWEQCVFILLALAACIPSTEYMLRRLFFPTVILWQGLKASASLQESARLSMGKLAKILWPLSLWNGIALILEGLSGYFLPLTLIALPLSFLISCAILAWSYDILTL